MSAEEMQVAPATASDLAADMDRHRHMYRTFLRLLMWVAGGSAVVIAILFLILN
ncbi:MAG: hypothetical protein IT534_11380 [Bauldia sp.]|nr:hypothetical protein [Bauldia sp.]